MTSVREQLSRLGKLNEPVHLHPRQDRVWLDYDLKSGWTLSIRKAAGEPVGQEVVLRLAVELNIPKSFANHLYRNHPDLLQDLVNRLAWAEGKDDRSVIGDPRVSTGTSTKSPVWPSLVRGIEGLIEEGWLRAVRIDSRNGEYRALVRLAQIEPLEIQAGRTVQLEPGIVITDHGNERHGIWTQPVLFGSRILRTLPLPYPDTEYRRLSSDEADEPGPVLAGKLLRGTNRTLFTEGLAGLKASANRWLDRENARTRIAELRIPDPTGELEDWVPGRLKAERISEFWLLWLCLGAYTEASPAKRIRAERIIGSIVWARGNEAP